MANFKSDVMTEFEYRANEIRKQVDSAIEREREALKASVADRAAAETITERTWMDFVRRSDVAILSGAKVQITGAQTKVYANMRAFSGSIRRHTDPAGYYCDSIEITDPTTPCLEPGNYFIFFGAQRLPD